LTTLDSYDITPRLDPAESPPEFRNRSMKTPGINPIQPQAATVGGDALIMLEASGA